MKNVSKGLHLVDRAKYLGINIKLHTESNLPYIHKYINICESMNRLRSLMGKIIAYNVI
jgi:hypothetical protein